MTIYNSQLKTLHKTKQLLKATMPEKEFKKWEGELVKRKPVQLRLLDIEMVGIMNYLFFKIFLCFFHPNIFKQFRTFLYFQGTSENVKLGRVGATAT